MTLAWKDRSPVVAKGVVVAWLAVGWFVAVSLAAIGSWIPAALCWFAWAMAAYAMWAER
jgi:hypothetical protein